MGRLTGKLRQQRGELIEAIAAAHPGRPYVQAVQEGAEEFGTMLARARGTAMPRARASIGELADLSPEQFREEFGARLAEVGSTDGLSSPFWR